MTTAPSDLLEFRRQIQSRTGLPAVSLGIVGDSAHAASGGYHEGRDDLTRVGRVGTDYSTRLARDKAGLTNSASAMDIGYHWSHGGDAAWLRFNGLLTSQLHAGDPALAAIRAVNYSPDGRRKQRMDRQTGWATESTTDTVDVHTHIEWYRDTEGKRQASISRLLELIDAAIANHPASIQEVPDLDTTQASQLANVAYTTTQIPQGTTRIPLHVWASFEAAAVARIEAALAASAQREQAALAAIQALAAGGTSVDTSAVVAAVKATGDQTSQAVTALQKELADTQSRLAAALTATTPTT